MKQEKTVYENDRLSYGSILTLFQNTVSLMSEDVRLFITCCYTINGGSCLPQGSARIVDLGRCPLQECPSQYRMNQKCCQNYDVIEYIIL